MPGGGGQAESPLGPGCAFTQASWEAFGAFFEQGGAPPGGTVRLGRPVTRPCVAVCLSVINPAVMHERLNCVKGPTSRCKCRTRTPISRMLLGSLPSNSLGASGSGAPTVLTASGSAHHLGEAWGVLGSPGPHPLPICHRPLSSSRPRMPSMSAWSCRAWMCSGFQV